MLLPMIFWSKRKAYRQNKSPENLIYINFFGVMAQAKAISFY
jgi:hypothetical protein